jgi:hypothetical protein
MRGSPDAYDVADEAVDGHEALHVVRDLPVEEIVAVREAVLRRRRSARATRPLGHFY